MDVLKRSMRSFCHMDFMSTCICLLELVDLTWGPFLKVGFYGKVDLPAPDFSCCNFLWVCTKSFNCSMGSSFALDEATNTQPRWWRKNSCSAQGTDWKVVTIWFGFLSCEMNNVTQLTWKRNTVRKMTSVTSICQSAELTWFSTQGWLSTFCHFEVRN